MKFLLTFSALFLLSWSSVTSASYQDLNNLLNKIKEAENKKLPQTALDLAKDLEVKAKAEKEEGIYLRAIAKQILNKAHIQGKQPKEKVKILREEIQKEKEERRPILKSLLAVWFWHYYQQNSYKFLNRTQTGNWQEDDFETWDLPKLQQEIITLFNEALKDQEVLKKISIQKYRGLIERGNIVAEDSTLFEFLSHEIINFYTNFYATTPSSEDDAPITTNSIAFNDYKGFMEAKLEELPPSLIADALKVYQGLMRFYAQKKNQELLLDVDLNRWQLLKERAVGEERIELIQKKYQSLAEEFKAFPTSTMALYYLALIHQDKKELVKAVEVCQEADKRFKDSDGARHCRNLIKTITQKYFQLEIENTINESNLQTVLRYKNINKLYFRIIKDDWDSYLTQEWADLGENPRRDRIQKLINNKAEKEWSIDLKMTDDYQVRREKIAIPKLPYGFYQIVASDKADFSESDDLVLYRSFWSTDTTIMVRSWYNEVQA